MTNSTQDLLPTRRWAVPGGTDTPEERPFNPQTDCVVTAQNPHSLQAIGRVNALHGAELRTAGLNLFQAASDPDWKPDPETACLLHVNLEMKDLDGQPMPLTPAEEEEPYGLDLVRVSEITASLRFRRGEAEWTLTWPIDTATTGIKMNHPFARVYLADGFAPHVEDMARTLLHLYFRPNHDQRQPYPTSYLKRTFIDDAITHLARQALPPEQAQDVILRHHFDRYVRPHLLPSVAYSIHGDHTTFEVLTRQCDEAA